MNGRTSSVHDAVSEPDGASGLSSAVAARRWREHGPNALPSPPRVSLWRRFFRQFRSPLIYVLLFALAFDAGSWLLEANARWPIEALAIGLVLLLNAGLGVYQEARSERALSELRALAAPLVWVMRDERLRRMSNEALVPGDLVRLEAGERVPADGVAIESNGFAIDESILTGESLPVDKRIDEELLSGTLVLRGKGFIRITRTGAASNMGRLAGLLNEIRTEQTPLEKRLAVLGAQIARLVFWIAFAMALCFLLVEGLGRVREVVLFAVALAVAAVPEGMPAVVTLTLALGVQRMARRNAVVRRLAAVETLGSVTAIATDKTGTLTENRLVVRELVADDVEQSLRAMALANEADVDLGAGDPLELALLRHVGERGVNVAELRREHRRVSVRSFDSESKFMRVTAESNGVRRSYLKGAPEILLARAKCDEHDAAHWRGRAEACARRGLRVIALATAGGECEEQLEILGLVALGDPPRVGVADAVAQARRAGVRVVMITGDHAETAKAIAGEVGIENQSVLTGPELDQLDREALTHAARTVSVFARVSPEHKLRLVEALQRDGEIVAMTGDGINDAPALKRADVGIAMGERGSDVAREVADIVLLDDNLATIVNAIEEGRSIYENIQSFIRYTFSTNVSLVFLIATAAVGSYFLGLRSSSGMMLLPLTAAQLLWVNFLGDGPPALAFALDRNPGLMSRPPRAAASPLLDQKSLRFIFYVGLSKGALGVSLLLVLPTLGYSLAAAQTAIFLYESIAKLLSAYPARSGLGRPARNVVLHIAVLLGVALQIATVSSPALRYTLGLEALDLRASSALALTIGVGLCCAFFTTAMLRRLARLEPADPVGS